MKAQEFIDYGSKLKGMSILESRTGEKLGNVSDLMLDPNTGKFLGVKITMPDKQTGEIGLDHIRIGADAVMITNGTSGTAQLPGSFAEAATAEEFLSSTVVSEDGQLIGKVQEIHIKPETQEVFLRIAESAVQKLFGGGFYVSGNIVRAFSRREKRLIVPSDIKEKYAKRSLHDNEIPE